MKHRVWVIVMVILSFSSLVAGCGKIATTAITPTNTMTSANTTPVSTVNTSLTNTQTTPVTMLPPR